MHAIEQGGDKRVRIAAARHLVNTTDLKNRRTHRHPWIQRGVWVLENHLDATPERAQGTALGCADILAPEKDPPRVRFHQSYNPPAARALSPPGPPRQAEDLPLRNVQGPTVNGPMNPACAVCRPPAP